MSITPETYEAVLLAYNYCCNECGSNTDLQLHHKLAGHKNRVKLYPLFIDSPFNLVPLCGGISNNCHQLYKNEYRISENEARLYEDYLQELKEK